MLRPIHNDNTVISWLLYNRLTQLFFMPTHRRRSLTLAALLVTQRRKDVRVLANRRAILVNISHNIRIVVIVNSYSSPAELLCLLTRLLRKVYDMLIRFTQLRSKQLNLSFQILYHLCPWIIIPSRFILNAISFGCIR